MQSTLLKLTSNSSSELLKQGLDAYSEGERTLDERMIPLRDFYSNQIIITRSEYGRLIDA